MGGLVGEFGANVPKAMRARWRWRYNCVKNDDDREVDRGTAANGVAGLFEPSVIPVLQSWQEMNRQYDNIKN